MTGQSIMTTPRAAERPLNRSRRAGLVCLAAAILMPPLWSRITEAQEVSQKIIEIRIENREVVEPQRAIRVTQGDLLKLRWQTDEAVDLHLHGYDVEIRVQPETASVMEIEAFASGRFPITSHGWGTEGHGHDALTYLEVYPD